MINSIEIQANGYVFCRSGFYCSHNTLGTKFIFANGLNTLIGEIDSKNWAISYLISMYKYRKKDFNLFEFPYIDVNDKIISLEDLMNLTCYMDDSTYPLFSTKKSVEKIVKKALCRTKSNMASEDVRNLFQIDKDRFLHPVSATGNEVFKAMAAIGYCHGKEIYCFPWMSQKRFDAFHLHLSWLIEQLVNLKKVVILPLGY